MNVSILISKWNGRESYSLESWAGSSIGFNPNF